MRKTTAIYLCGMIALLLFLNGNAKAQSPDTTQVTTDTLASRHLHSPKKATLYSAILPGLGQAYNKKYWKIPIVYAGFAGCTYLIVSNNTEYRKFIAAYNYIHEGAVGEPPNDYAVRYGTTEQLLNGQYLYRRALEQSVIFTVLWYGLTIIDATVDAHFFYFDISEDLSVDWKPKIIQPAPGIHYTGVALTFKF
ncbi:MAG: hypothetical protein EOL88_05015 [Bacteroidia bacterium]|nr:hypothetical protein [Bacteroidia bacterium]